MNPYTTHGAISWPELMTADPEKVAKFYADVLGWTTEVMPMPTGDYTVCKIDGNVHAGIMAPPSGEMPSFWQFYVTVDDVEAIAKKAVDLGATIIMEPMTVPTVGTFAGIRDPQGAVLMAITYEPPGEQASDQPEPDFAQTFQTHGAFSWYELRTPDAEGAVNFYKDLFGWNVRTDHMGMGPYHVTMIGDVGFGGIINPPPGAPPHWAAYVTVADLDATMEKVKAHGGQIGMEPIDVERVGRFTMFQDPGGAWLAAMQYAPMDQA